MMTRKHYKMIAELLGKCETLEDFTSRLCSKLREDNPRFDSTRFYKAIRKEHDDI